MASGVEEIKAFLKENVINKNSNVEENLKKNFTLGKRKLKKKGKDKTGKKKPKLMNRRQKKEMGLFHVPVKSMKYEEALPLNELWLSYMRNMLKSYTRVPELHEKAWENFSMAVFKSDYHGAIVSVLDSKCDSLKGIEGICMMESKNTFRILTDKDTLKTVPKLGSLFKFHYDNYDFSIYGKDIARRPAERSIKIPKVFSLSEL